MHGNKTNVKLLEKNSHLEIQWKYDYKIWNYIIQIQRKIFLKIEAQILKD